MSLFALTAASVTANTSGLARDTDVVGRRVSSECHEVFTEMQAHVKHRQDSAMERGGLMVVSFGGRL